MKTTSQTLIEQLKITKNEIERRKEYIRFTDKEVTTLMGLKEMIIDHVDEIIDHFYDSILPFDEMDRIIGDAETLKRLRNYQRNYVLSLFEGHYGEDYVHSRLRIGLVHKRIGVDPRFYVSALHNLSSVLRTIVKKNSKHDCKRCIEELEAIDKILMFDLSLTFDTYINSLMDEVKRSRHELEKYTESLEEIITERTKLLSEQARRDGLTGLLNQRAFYEALRRELSRGQRQNHSTTLIYFDLDGFKKLNDTQGHRRGDEILVAVAEAANKTLRESDSAARYGGDEFCILLPESTTADGEMVGKRVCVLIEESTTGSGITCSMGVATSTSETGYDADTLVKTADKAMYEAKKEPGFSIKRATG